MEFKGSRTEANLMAAFSGESMARNKYDFYAKVARSEGLIQVAEIFEETARNEHYHAKLWYRSLGKLGGTAENLKDAQAGEHYEWTDMYARFEREALDEGFDRMAALFRMVGNIERMHDERYGAFIAQLEKDLLYRKAQPIRWICILYFPCNLQFIVVSHIKVFACEICREVYICHCFSSHELKTCCRT